uniref:Uncharacterized protein n=1 Tax=Neospora caninum (strain Liverpool) TaxID=572307 RepID=A0A0F7UM68_NEOCL|nr:TPA: hypothetical protein BN1204_066860 [Neospora caninum Liverpool]
MCQLASFLLCSEFISRASISSNWSKTASTIPRGPASAAGAAAPAGTLFFLDACDSQKGTRRHRRPTWGRGACPNVSRYYGAVLQGKLGTHSATKTPVFNVEGLSRAGKPRSAFFSTSIRTPVFTSENSRHQTSLGGNWKRAAGAATSWKPGVCPGHGRFSNSKKLSASVEENGTGERPVTRVHSFLAAHDPLCDAVHGQRVMKEHLPEGIERAARRPKKEGASTPLSSQFCARVAASSAGAPSHVSAHRRVVASRPEVDSSRLSPAATGSKDLPRNSRLHVNEVDAPSRCMLGTVVGRRAERTKARREQQIHLLQLEAVLRMRTGPFPAFIQPVPLADVCRMLSDIWSEAED